MTPAIELSCVTAGYRARPVLTDLSFAVAPGERVALLGPNGAGKSTLLRVVTGLHAAQTGRVRLFGREVHSLAAPERARLVSVVPQDLDVPMAFSVEELVLMGRHATLGRWSPPGPRDRAAVEEAMAYTDTLDLRRRPFPELSGGERQRVIVALALAAEPRLLLLDEPTSHLDMNHRVEIVQLIERLNAEKGLAVVMVGHDLNLAAEYFPRLVLLDHGQIVADGTATQVLTPAMLRAVYHCDVHVQPDSLSGCLRVFPRRAATAGRADTPGAATDTHRVHVVCGGGCGGEVIRRLRLTGHPVSCGVLNDGDSDAACGRALGAAVVLEKPFSAIGPEALQQAREQVATCTTVIVCEVPFGTGNVANLTLAEEALRAGKHVWVHTGQLDRRDYTPTREAEPRVAALLAAGARPWTQVADLLDGL